MPRRLKNVEEKHDFNDLYRYYILFVSMCLVGFGVAMIALALYLNTCNNSPMISYGYIFMGPIVVLVSVTGFYGAWRVREDVDAEVNSTPGKMVQVGRGLQLHNPDGKSLLLLQADREWGRHNLIVGLATTLLCMR